MSLALMPGSVALRMRDLGRGVWLRYDFKQGELLMAHEKPKWYDRYWYWFVIAFGIACMLGVALWHPVLGG